MFGIFDEVTDIATSVVGEVAEVASLGLIDSKDAKQLAKAGLTVAEIATELDITTIVARKLLNTK